MVGLSPAGFPAGASCRLTVAAASPAAPCQTGHAVLPHPAFRHRSPRGMRSRVAHLSAQAIDAEASQPRRRVSGVASSVHGARACSAGVWLLAARRLDRAALRAGRLVGVSRRGDPTLNECTDIVEEAHAIRLEIARDEVAGWGFRRPGRFVSRSSIWTNQFRPHSLWILWRTPFLGSSCSRRRPSRSAACREQV